MCIVSGKPRRISFPQIQMRQNDAQFFALGFFRFRFHSDFRFERNWKFKGGHKYVGPPRASRYHSCSVLSARSVIKEPTSAIDTNGFQSSDLQMSKPVQWLALIMIALARDPRGAHCGLRLPLREDPSRLSVCNGTHCGCPCILRHIFISRIHGFEYTIGSRRIPGPLLGWPCQSDQRLGLLSPLSALQLPVSFASFCLMASNRYILQLLNSRPPKALPSLGTTELACFSEKHESISVVRVGNVVIYQFL